MTDFLLKKYEDLAVPLLAKDTVSEFMLQIEVHGITQIIIIH